MRTILNEISKLRSGAPIVIDYHNSNRYRVVVQENDGTKTAYYFSTPIYNNKTRKLVDLKFRAVGEKIYATGSNANITLSQTVRMENDEGTVSVELPKPPVFVSAQEAKSGECTLFPTTNGVAIKCDVRNNSVHNFIIESRQAKSKVRSNDRYVALLKKKFRPLVIWSCIGSLDASGSVISPAKVKYKKLADRKYRVSVSATSPLADAVLFEVNMYENKLFQDTTVESAHPGVNNAFGSVGFIGDSSAYGTQWLYSRLDYSLIPEMAGRRVHKIVLHMPKLNRNDIDVSAFKVAARFCSFGSKWKNKIADGARVSDSQTINAYQSIDITSLLVDPQTRTILDSDGLILKSKVKDSGFSVISTGDGYFAPQILAVNYR